MGRLTLIPPHLMDMPVMGMGRTPLDGSSPISSAAPGARFDYDANFNAWDRSLDQVTANAGANDYDLTTSYPDGEFWGMNRTTGQILRGKFDASGVMQQLGSYAWPTATPTTIYTPSQQPSFISPTSRVIRVSATQIAYVGLYNENNTTSRVGVMTCSWDGTAFVGPTRAAYWSNNSAQEDRHVVATRLTLNTILVGHAGEYGQLAPYCWLATLPEGGAPVLQTNYNNTRTITAGYPCVQVFARIDATRAIRAMILPDPATSGGCTLDILQYAGSGSQGSGIILYQNNGSAVVQPSPILLPMSGTRCVVYNPATLALEVWATIGLGLTKLTSTPVPTSVGGAAFAQCLGLCRATDGDGLAMFQVSGQNQQSCRFFLNSDDTIGFGPRGLTGAPYALRNHQFAQNIGLVLPGDYALVGHRPSFNNAPIANIYAALRAHV